MVHKNIFFLWHWGMNPEVLYCWAIPQPFLCFILRQSLTELLSLTSNLPSLGHKHAPPPGTQRCLHCGLEGQRSRTKQADTQHWNGPNLEHWWRSTLERIWSSRSPRPLATAGDCKMLQPLWQTDWQFPKKLNIFSASASTQKVGNSYPHKTLHRDSHGSSIHVCQNLDTTKALFSRRMGTLVLPPNGALSSAPVTWATKLWKVMEETQVQILEKAKLWIPQRIRGRQQLGKGKWTFRAENIF